MDFLCQTNKLYDCTACNMEINIFNALTCGQKTMHFMDSRLVHKSFTLDKISKGQIRFFLEFFVKVFKVQL